jgi:two-component system, OmpR family, phosphate regulon sensor histidine kinase PhoR
VKKIFTIITVLITLSLVGITILQVSWVRNMVSLRKEQIKHLVDESTKEVALDLAKHKGSYTLAQPKKGFFADEITLDIFRPTSIARSIAGDDIKKKIEAALRKNKLKNVRFEFGIQAFNMAGDIVFDNTSPGFLQEITDTLNNHSSNVGIEALTGTAGENLSINESLFVIVPDIKALVYRDLRWRIAISLLFTAIILAAFYLTVRTMLKQKKLGEIKNDFINNMTHEFKTPIATISLAVDAMRNEKVINDKEKLGYFSSIIKEENQRMNKQVETILKASQLEKQEIELNLSPLHAHEVVKAIIENFELQLQDKKGKVELQLNAASDLINADEVHFANLVNNLVDNAIKYAKDNVPPVIKVSTHSTNKYFNIRVEDNGIGMNRDTLKRIFEKFYRAHTGNVHNVKGFGLGLSYVKAITDAHGGEIKAESTLGKGSVLTLDFPLQKNTN